MIARLFTAFAALALAATPVTAPAQDYPPQPALSTPKPFSVPKSETYTLPNGMQVTLIPISRLVICVSLPPYLDAC